MKVPPRSPKTKLVSNNLLFYAYGFAGWPVAVGCFAAYLSVYMYHGIMPKDLLFTHEPYWDLTSDNLTTSTGMVIPASEQVIIRGQAAAAWQVTLVTTQRSRNDCATYTTKPRVA
uniref:Uncharacterized protein n=1 Tax=Panagrolaimus superbus TaxID=310955 RepID=A0A914XW66_9BILA